MMKIKSAVLILAFLFWGGSHMMSGQQLGWDASYVRIEIKGMACPFCAGGMGKTLKALEGVQKVHMVFDHGLAILTVSKLNVPSIDKLEKVIKEAGFQVGEITYSDEPFEIPEPIKKKKKSKLQG